MSELDPITREEVLLNSIAEGTGSDLEPITRQEMYLSAIAGESELPTGMEPITREEIYYQKILDNGGSGGGGEATGTKYISINSNGTTTSNVKAYATAEITTNVPNSYDSSDEGKVVSNGALVSQTSKNVTSNGTVDTTLNNEVVVNVPTGTTPTGTKNISITQNGTTTEDVTNYASAQIAVNVPNPSTGTKSITQNGTHDVTDYASASVNVANSYSASDEGKVVDDGALVSQTSQTVTENGTYDTTLKNEVVVNVASSGGGVNTEEGYVELTDVSTNSVTIPVDLTSATVFILNLYAVGTGEVSGGAVTEYDHIEIPTVFASNSFVWNYMLKYPQNPAPVVYRDSTNLSSLSVCYNTSYTHAKRGSNGAQIGIAYTPTISASGLTTGTMNGGRLFCMAGAYAKFKYEITWW